MDGKKVWVVNAMGGKKNNLVGQIVGTSGSGGTLNQVGVHVDVTRISRVFKKTRIYSTFDLSMHDQSVTWMGEIPR